MSSEQTFNFFKMYTVSVFPIMETFLETISKDYNLPLDEMKQRYLYDDKKTFTKMVKKYKTKKSRKITPYNVYLSDKNITQMLLDEKKTTKQTEINPEKGELWKKYKKDENIFKKYENISKLENKGLITKDNRNELLTTWKTNKKVVDKILKTSEKDDTLDLCKVLEMLNLTPQEDTKQEVVEV